MSKTSQTNTLRNNQKGFASIVIALVLIIVLSLLTVGFAQLARREQQNALDKQLADQAQYAAESGINDAVLGIQGNPKASPAIAPTITDSTANVNTNNCLNSPLVNSSSSTISSTYGVTYNCVLVNLQPPSIQYDNVGAGSGRYITFSTVNSDGVPDAAKSFTVQWGSADAHNSFPASTTNKLTPLSTWNANKYPGVLQVSITPLGDLSRQGLINNTFTAYLYPASSGFGTLSYTTYSSPVSTEGALVSGHCSLAVSTEYPCQLTIDVSSSGGGSGPYLIHLVDYYDSSNVNVNGVDAGGGTLSFTDGQAQIDATGKAKNVSKRLQVRIPIKASAAVPNFVIEGQNICKRFDTFPGSTTADTLPGCDLN